MYDNSLYHEVYRKLRHLESVIDNDAITPANIYTVLKKLWSLCDGNIHIMTQCAIILADTPSIDQVISWGDSAGFTVSALDARCLIRYINIRKRSKDYIPGDVRNLIAPSHGTREYSAWKYKLGVLIDQKEYHDKMNVQRPNGQMPALKLPSVELSISRSSSGEKSMSISRSSSGEKSGIFSVTETASHGSPNASPVRRVESSYHPPLHRAVSSQALPRGPSVPELVKMASQNCLKHSSCGISHSKCLDGVASSNSCKILKRTIVSTDGTGMTTPLAKTNNSHTANYYFPAAKSVGKLEAIQKIPAQTKPTNFTTTDSNKVKQPKLRELVMESLEFRELLKAREFAKEDQLIKNEVFRILKV
mmetsp:Transcript_1912/g.3034  ORF Transcript_1912/g.3034 Transcript_1912/m.3034 type:complete len:362 (-) Transcript_1912:130-1215(-)